MNRSKILSLAALAALATAPSALAGKPLVHGTNRVTNLAMPSTQLGFFLQLSKAGYTSLEGLPAGGKDASCRSEYTHPLAEGCFVEADGFGVGKNLDMRITDDERYVGWGRNRSDLFGESALPRVVVTVFTTQVATTNDFLRGFTVEWAQGGDDHPASSPLEYLESIYADWQKHRIGEAWVPDSWKRRPSRAEFSWNSLDPLLEDIRTEDPYAGVTVAASEPTFHQENRDIPYGTTFGGGANTFPN